MSGSSLHGLEAMTPDGGALNVIIETPKGHANKYKFNERLGLFELSKALPLGSVFPYDFGFLPATHAQDGDPLDILVLMEEPAFTGCLIRARPIGVIEAEQTEHSGEVVRNDRVLAVAEASHLYADVTSLDGLSNGVVDEIEHFFISYNAMEGRKFRPLRRAGPDRARELIEEAAGAGK